VIGQASNMRQAKRANQTTIDEMTSQLGLSR